MATYQSPLAVIVKGALAGAAGTAVMGAFMERAPHILESFGIRLPADRPGPTASDAPTEAIAERVAEGVAKHPLDDRAKATAGQAVHWTYGAAWGAFFGVMQSTLKLPHLVHGTIFGALVGVVADTLMPAMRLQRDPRTNPAPTNVMHMVSHIVFGWTTAFVYAALNLGRRG
ncbi:MAG: hypothetical protein ACT4OQ_03445 [Chloroflexota bacterium]